eukprot:4885052-Pyramimonas_sp.AAC.1
MENLKGAGEKWCTTCEQWAEMASTVAGGGVERNRVFVRTSKCDRCAGPAAARKSRKTSEAWRGQVQEKFKIRCGECLEFLKTEAEIAANQYATKSAGEKLCKKCAGKRKGGWNKWSKSQKERECENEMNAARRAARQQKPLKCSACPSEADGTGGTFTDTRHLTPDQLQKYYKTGAGHRPVMCRSCQEEHEKSRVLRCSACPKGADGKGPEIMDTRHLTVSQKRHYWDTGTAHRPVMCHACLEKSEAQ